MSEIRPFPNVERRGRGWTAKWPRSRRAVYLGLFPTPEQARIAVLEAQARHLESKAQGYRDEAAALRK